MRSTMMAAIVAMFGAILLTPAPGAAAPAQRHTGTAAATPTEFSAQNRRVRPRLRVTPRYPYRNYHSAYPLPYSNEYPGPNAVRQCTDWYATEYRASGPVIVPKMRCWWVPG